MAILYACWLKIKQHPVIALSALGALLAIPIVIALFIFTIITGGTADDGSGSNCSTSSTEDYSADFKITNWGPAAAKHGNASKEIEKWGASQHLNAAQTAGVLGNAMAESGVGTNGSGGGKYGDFLGAGSEAADTSHNGDSVSAYMNWFVNTFSNTGTSSGGHNNGAWNKYKSMKSSSPYTLGYFWGAHLDAAAAGNYSQRGKWAQDAYKTISGGSSNITTAADTSESGSSCGKSSDDDSGDGSDIIKLGKKYLGIPYGQGSRYQSIKDILAGKPKSEVADNDCDGFVYAILRALHYQTPSTYWGNVGGMDNYYKSKHEIIPKSETHAGTPCTYPPDAPDYSRLGHAFFLEEHWKGSSTKILQEGPDNSNSGHTIEWSLTGGDFSDIHCYALKK